MIEEFSYDNLIFDDSRGKFPEPIRAQAPLGTRARMKRVATAQGITYCEAVRRALTSYIEGSNAKAPSHTRAALTYVVTA